MAGQYPMGGGNMGNNRGNFNMPMGGPQMGGQMGNQVPGQMAPNQMMNMNMGGMGGQMNMGQMRGFPQQQQPTGGNNMMQGMAQPSMGPQQMQQQQMGQQQMAPQQMQPQPNPQQSMQNMPMNAGQAIMSMSGGMNSSNQSPTHSGMMPQHSPMSAPMQQPNAGGSMQMGQMNVPMSQPMNGNGQHQPLQTPTTPNVSTAGGMYQNVQQQMQQRQQHQSQQQGGPVQQPGTGNAPQQKEFNVLSLCRVGQETVQDILTRFSETFNLLNAAVPPTMQGDQTSATNEKKITESFRTIRLLFKRLRLLYEKTCEGSHPLLEYTHIESLIPLKDGTEHKLEPVHTEEYKILQQENRDLTETLMLRNKQLREVIGRIRVTVWEINTMLAMRKS